MRRLIASWPCSAYTLRRVGRRALLHTGAVSAATAAASSLASCLGGGGAGTSKPPVEKIGVVGTITASDTTQPQSGGILTTYLTWTPQTLDVHTYTATMAQATVAGVYSNVVRFDWYNGGAIAPDLAERWEINDDGTVYIFALRKNVKWHDGRPFTSEDVKFNIERVISKEIAPKSQLFGQILQPAIDRVDTPDASTLVIKIKHPYPIVLQVLAGTNARIMPKHVLSIDGAIETTWIGTGPFRLKRFEKDNIVEWERNPEYFIPGVPYLDGVQKFVLGDKATQVSALGSGRVLISMLWPALLPSEVKLIQAQAGDKVIVAPGQQNAMERMFVNHTRPPFNDRRVRRAVLLALDPYDIRQRVFEGTGVVSTLDPRVYKDYAIPPADVEKMPGFRRPKDQDLADARKLLAAAGYPDGVDFRLVVRNTADYVAYAQVVAQQLNKIGLRAKLEVEESTAGLVRQQKGDFDMANVGGSGTLIDPFNTLKQMYVNQNPAPFPDTNLHSMIDQGLKTMEEQKRKEIARRIQQYILTEDTANYIVGWNDSPVVIWKRVKNYASPADMNQGMDYTYVWLAP